jgi:hypothetical protein
MIVVPHMFLQAEFFADWLSLHLGIIQYHELQSAGAACRANGFVMRYAAKQPVAMRSAEPATLCPSGQIQQRTIHSETADDPCLSSPS